MIYYFSGIVFAKLMITTYVEENRCGHLWQVCFAIIKIFFPLKQLLDRLAKLGSILMNSYCGRVLQVSRITSCSTLITVCIVDLEVAAATKALKLLVERKATTKSSAKEPKMVIMLPPLLFSQSNCVGKH